MIYAIAFVAGAAVALTWLKVRNSTERYEWRSWIKERFRQ